MAALPEGSQQRGKHKYHLRDHRTPTLSQGQLGAKQLEDILESESTQSPSFAIPIGSLVSFTTSKERIQDMYPIGTVIATDKWDPIRPASKAYFVAFIDLAASLQNWQNGQKDPIIINPTHLNTNDYIRVKEQNLTILEQDPMNNISSAMIKCVSILQKNLADSVKNKDDELETISKQVIWDLFYEVHKSLGERALIKPNPAKINVSDSLIVSIQKYLGDYGVRFRNDGQDRSVLIAKFCLEQAQNFVPKQYLLYKEGDYTYNPTGFVLRYKKQWEGQKLRMEWICVKTDSKGNVITA